MRIQQINDLNSLLVFSGLALLVTQTERQPSNEMRICIQDKNRRDMEEKSMGHKKSICAHKTHFFVNLITCFIYGIIKSIL